MLIGPAIKALLQDAAACSPAELAERSKGACRPGEKPLTRTTIATMTTAGWGPRSIRNLDLLSRTLSLDPPRRSPEPGGDGQAGAAGGGADGGAASPQGDDAAAGRVAEGVSDGVHGGQGGPANGVRQLETGGDVQGRRR